MGGLELWADAGRTGRTLEPVGILGGFDIWASPNPGRSGSENPGICPCAPSVLLFDLSISNRRPFRNGQKIPAARKLVSGKCFIWNLGRAKAAVQKMGVPCFLSGIWAKRGICPNDLQAIPKQHPGGLRAVSGTALRVFHHARDARDAHGKNSKAARATLTPRRSCCGG